MLNVYDKYNMNTRLVIFFGQCRNKEFTIEFNKTINLKIPIYGLTDYSNSE
jgi:hypothetical protein